MDSGTDTNSDLDEEFPVFLKPDRHLNHTSPDRQPLTTDLDCAEEGLSSKLKGPFGSCAARVVDVMTISSDSDDDAPYVPLAQRLKQRQANVITASSHLSDPPCGFTKLRSPPISHQPSTETLDHPQQPSSSVSPVKTTKHKRGAEEIQASKDEALRRKQYKEKQQRNKEALRLEQEQQKAQKKVLAEAAKALRPEECIKHMVAVVDPALLQLEGGGALLSSLQALGCSCAIEKQPLPRSVSWMRKTPGAQMPTGGECELESHVVIQMTVEDFISLSHSYIQEERRGRSQCGCTLTSWVQDLQKRHPERTLSLVVVGLEQYFRSNKTQSQKKLREAVVGEEQGGAKKKRKYGAAETLPEMSRVEVEEAVVHLQLHTGVSIRFLSTWKDFIDHITMATKAVAEAPFKRQRDNSGFSFYLESEWAGGQKVDRAGKGLLQVWKRQIQQLNRVSADMASAILAAYPSPQLLNKAYQACRTEKEKMELLSELQIRRGEGVTSTTRRVGPELSKRLCVLMNCCDPEQTLGTAA